MTCWIQFQAKFDPYWNTWKTNSTAYRWLKLKMYRTLLLLYPRKIETKNKILKLAFLGKFISKSELKGWLFVKDIPANSAGILR